MKLRTVTTHFFTPARASMVCALTLFVTLFVSVPCAGAASDDTTGDPGLAATLEVNATDEMNNLAAFTIDGPTVHFAGLGADEHSEFEIASLTKTFNYELLRQAIESAQVSLDTTYSDITGVTDTPVSSVTLRELATHTSGLPSLPQQPWLLGPSTSLSLTNANPYALIGKENVLELAQTQELTERGTENYSNMGAAVLGELLARINGTDYTTLLNEKILTPLGMNNTFVMTEDTITPESPRGLGNLNLPAQPWIMGSFSPAGGLRSTPADMARFAEHLLKGGIPDYGWIEATDGARWHDGLSTGFNSMLIMDPADHQAVFVIGDASSLLDPSGPKNVFPVAEALNDQLHGNKKCPTNR